MTVFDAGGREYGSKELLAEQNKRDFQLCFNSPSGREVLAYLALFCRATESPFVPGDKNATFVAIGRHEVWLRIQNYLNLAPAQLVGLYSGRTVQIDGEKNG